LFKLIIYYLYERCAFKQIIRRPAVVHHEHLGLVGLEDRMSSTKNGFKGEVKGAGEFEGTLPLFIFYLTQLE